MRKRNVGQGVFDVKNSPGPANYNPKAYHSSKSPSYTIGKKRSSSDDESEAPGPGSYDHAEQKYNRKAYRFANSVHRDVIDQDSPGPGAYESFTSKKSLGVNYGFPLDKRTSSYIQKKTESMPGPGSYEIN
jgi:hypothetical protein